MQSPRSAIAPPSVSLAHYCGIRLICLWPGGGQRVDPASPRLPSIDPAPHQPPVGGPVRPGPPLESATRAAVTG